MIEINVICKVPIYFKNTKKKLYSNLCQFYANFMLIYVKNIKKKKNFLRTDRRTTQNCSSEQRTLQLNIGFFLIKALTDQIVVDLLHVSWL